MNLISSIITIPVAPYGAAPDPMTYSDASVTVGVVGIYLAVVVFLTALMVAIRNTPLHGFGRKFTAKRLNILGALVLALSVIAMQFHDADERYDAAVADWKSAHHARDHAITAAFEFNGIVLAESVDFDDVAPGTGQLVHVEHPDSADTLCHLLGIDLGGGTVAAQIDCGNELDG